MKKQTLNEEIGRIKSIMGCCKGKINEAEADCFSPESPQAMQILNMAAEEVQELGLDNSDLDYTQQDTPEITDAKKKVADMLNPLLKTATKDQLKTMIKELKDMRRQRKNNKSLPAPKPTETNEQLEPAAAALASVKASGAAAWGSVKAFLLTIPTGVFIAIAAWLLLRLLKCHIYLALGKLSVNCGSDIQKSLLVKLAELVFLDFKNLFETDPILHNCERGNY